VPWSVEIWILDKNLGLFVLYFYLFICYYILYFYCYSFPFCLQIVNSYCFSFTIYIFFHGLVWFSLLLLLFPPFVTWSHIFLRIYPYLCPWIFFHFSPFVSYLLSFPWFSFPLFGVFTSFHIKESFPRRPRPMLFSLLFRRDILIQRCKIYPRIMFFYTWNGPFTWNSHLHPKTSCPENILPRGKNFTHLGRCSSEILLKSSRSW
jgi:hypothetical protein